MSRYTVYAIVPFLLVGAVCAGVSNAVHFGLDASARHSSSTDNQSNSAKEVTKPITGRVVDESGQPIPNAGVYLRKSGPQGGTGRSIGTDEFGRFHADDLDTGAYSATAYVPGYVPATEVVEREYYRPGDVISLRMMKGGVITGTVTTSSGEPVVGVRVSAIRVRDGESRPIRGASQSVNSRQTDDRGVYRAYGLLPGTYLMFASGAGQVGVQAAAYENDVPTYYPSATRDVASEVAVRAGQEISGIDIRYRGDQGHMVTGTLSGALGEGSAGLRGATVTLAHRSSGAIESRTFVQPQAGRGFAVYGVPDGDYELTAQMNVGAEDSSASMPRHVVVKGADITGIELSLSPLGWVSGRAVLEKLPDAQRPPECRGKPTASLEELVLMARLDEKAGAKGQLRLGVVAPSDTSPDENGDFKIASLAAGRYRIKMRLPTDDWFARAMTMGGSAASKQKDIAGAGLAIGAGQRVNNLIVTVAEGAAALRGKVIPASARTRLPAELQLHLIPAEPESADDVMRFAEVKVDSEGAFSLKNLGPGRYFLHLRAVAEDQLLERNPQPLAWDAALRAKLRREALSANLVIELGRCQRVVDYVLKYPEKE